MIFITYLNKPNVIPALAMHFLVGCLFVTCTSYVNALFLTSYPSTWLPYFFAGQIGIDIIFGYFLSSFLEKNPRNRAAIIELISAPIILLLMYLLTLNIFVTPLIFSFFLMGLSSFTGIMAWNSARAAFDFMTFKKIGNWINITSGISYLVFSFLIILLVNQFNLMVLPVLATIITFSLCVCFYLLKPISEDIRINKKIKAPINYPLFRQFFIVIGMIAFSSTLIDYLLKYKLSQIYNAKEIAQFMGIFIGVGNGLSLLFNLLFSNKVIMRYGIVSLIAILPIYWMSTGLVIITTEQMAAIVIFAAGRLVFYYGAFNLGREIIINILPDKIKNSAEFILKSVASPLGGALATAALILIGGYLQSPVHIVVITFIISLITLYYLRNLNSTYFSTLKDEIFLKRFISQNKINELNQGYLKGVIVALLKMEDARKIRIAFSFLENIKFPYFITEMMLHIDSPEVDIRSDVIKNIMRYTYYPALPILLKKIMIEENLEIKGLLFAALANFKEKNPSDILDMARQYYRDSSAEIRSGALQILFSSEDLQDQANARSSLNGMINHTNPKMREEAAKILGIVSIADITLALKQLVADKDKQVSLTAIDAIGKKKLVNLLPEVVERIGRGGITHVIKKTLIGFNSQITVLLISSIEKNIQRNIMKMKVFHWIRALGFLDNEMVEVFLEKLVNDKNVMIVNVALEELVYRAFRWGVSTRIKTLARSYIQKEVDLIALFNVFIKEYSLHPEVAAEFESRKYLAKKRFIYWLALNTKLNDVFNLLPTLLSDSIKEKSKPVELLMLIVEDKNLNKLIEKVILDYPMAAPPDVISSNQIYLDDWLNRVIQYSISPREGKTMSDMQIVFLLRSTELFKHLSGEVLLVIAEEMKPFDMIAGQIIFSQGDLPDGMYVINSGQVSIVRNNKILVDLKEGDVFGELALIDESPRSATAIVKKDGVAFFLEKEAFDRITADLPEVLANVVHLVMRYLRSYIKEEGLDAIKRMKNSG